MQKKPAVKINKPPILFPQTQKIITKIEKKLDGPFIAYWSSGNGSVCHNDVAGYGEGDHAGYSRRSRYQLGYGHPTGDVAFGDAAAIRAGR